MEGRATTGIKKSSNEPSRFISDPANRFPRFFEKIGGQGARLLIGIWSLVAVHPSTHGYSRERGDNGARPLEKYPLEPRTIRSRIVFVSDEVFPRAFSPHCRELLCAISTRFLFLFSRAQSV